MLTSPDERLDALGYGIFALEVLGVFRCSPCWLEEVACVLTIAKMGAHSVAYYQSTVDENRGPDSYYSEDGKQPASV